MTIFRQMAPAIVAPMLLSFLFMIFPLQAFADEAEAVPQDVFHIQDIPTNLGIAYGMAADVAEKTLESLSETIGGNRIAFRPVREHSGNSLIVTALTEAARRHSLELAINSSQSDYIIDFSILELRIAYTGTDRGALFLKKEIERAGSCVLACSLVDSDSMIEMTTLQQEVLVTDHFPSDMLEVVKSSTYPFTSPEYTSKDWSKAVEPFVVTGLVTGLIYLFFSNQSSD
ncbi:MAG: hypothetical protein GY835_21505 [bacterium]|nr:hypothetical protein [bacterium]